MLKTLTLTLALAAAPTLALAQQNTDIDGASFQSGGADAALAALGREAAASGARLVITAPHDWHDRIAAKVKAGGKAQLVLRDGFYESVLVRVEDRGAARQEAAKEAAVSAAAERTRAEAQRSKAELEQAKAEVEAARAEAERAKAEAEAARAAAERANAAAAAARAQVEADAAARAEAERAAAESARLEAERVAAAAAAANGIDAVRARLEKSLNDGRPASGSLSVDKLASGDTLYVDGAVRAVVRRDRGKALLYWLDGDLDLRRSELKELAPNRYQVLGLIRGEGTLRREFADAGRVEAQVPAASAAARLSFEQNLNNGQTFNDTLRPADLRSGDMLYVDGSTIAVAHRDGLTLKRYWLQGPIDLNQDGLLREAASRYRVTRDTIR
ncbi:hypothetical protein [Dokdonella sp.]|uniref:hypothetical protein n=1 Tax=Dokdonella sp. TaxID=2291710 RepID=UPI0027B94D6E|nr:hypothetical protein [Dokdonella sp.]